MSRAENAKPVEAGMIVQAAQGPFLYGPNGQPIVWMGPGAAIAPAIPNDTPPRSWDYPTFWNVYRTTDAGKALESGVTFSQLRMLANQTHVRAAIETVKDKQVKKEWTWALKPKPGEKYGDTLKRTKTDSRVAEIEAFFESPDGENDFGEWLRLWLEDLLTIGAAVIVRWENIDETPFRLEVFDAGTIEPLLDARGRRPQQEGDPAFQQFIKGVPFENFGYDELVYLGRNPRPGKVYPLGPVEQLLTYINIAMRKDITRLSHFTDGNVPAGLLPMPEGWNSDQIQKWYTSFNAFVLGLPHNLVKLIPIPGGGGSPVFPGLEAIKQGETWDELWIRMVCAVFGISPSSWVHQQNRATAEVARSQADEEGEQVMTDFIRRTLNRLIKKWFGYDDIICRPKAEQVVEPKTQADIDKSNVTLGIMQVNEIRERDGLEPIEELIGVNAYYDAKGGFTPFDAAIEAANNPELVNEPPDPASMKPERTVPIPTNTGKVLRFKEGERVLTKRGMVPVEELMNGDELVTVDARKGY